jgi:type II secretory pathway pseudopilin PulG
MLLPYLPRILCLLAVCITLSLAVSDPVYASSKKERKRQQKEEQAAVLRVVAMKYFDAMDTNKDGLLGYSEINRAIKKKVIEPADMPTIKWMRDNMDSVGHVVRTDNYNYTTNAGPTVFTVPIPRAVYGISKADLLQYGLPKTKEKKEGRQA